MNFKSIPADLFEKLNALLPESWKLYGEKNHIGGFTVGASDLEILFSSQKAIGVEIPKEIIEIIEALDLIDEAPQNGVVLSSENGELLGLVEDVDFEPGKTYVIASGRMYTHPVPPFVGEQIEINHRDFSGMGNAMQGRLNEAGFVFVHQLLEVSAEELADRVTPGLNSRNAERFQEQARQILENGE